MSNFFSTSKANRPIIIAEAGVNHDGDIDMALRLIESAARSGSDYIKFQTYSAERLAANYSPAYWDLDEEPTNSQIELFKKYDFFDLDDYKLLFEKCMREKIGFLTTCFDTEWLNLLSDYLPFFKIASADITNFVLISEIAQKHKPILMSTGAASFDEISSALNLIRSITDADVCLMHCVLNYPTEFENVNLARIVELKRKFPDVAVGYSDHTRPEYSFSAISIAMNMGATVIEKHFTHDKSLQGNDHYHSFDWSDFEVLIRNLELNFKMSKFDEGEFLAIQSDARKFARRGLYAVRNLAANTTISLEDIIPLRPTIEEAGFLGNEISTLLGRRCIRDIKAGEPFLKSDLL